MRSGAPGVQQVWPGLWHGGLQPAVALARAGTRQPVRLPGEYCETQQPTAGAGHDTAPPLVARLARSRARATYRVLRDAGEGVATALAGAAGAAESAAPQVAPEAAHQAAETPEGGLARAAGGLPDDAVGGLPDDAAGLAALRAAARAAGAAPAHLARGVRPRGGRHQVAWHRGGQ